MDRSDKTTVPATSVGRPRFTLEYQGYGDFTLLLDGREAFWLGATKDWQDGDSEALGDLIAAAPAMYEALEEILCCHDGNQADELNMPDLDYARRTISSMHRIARAALAQASNPSPQQVVGEKSEMGE